MGMINWQCVPAKQYDLSTDQHLSGLLACTCAERCSTGEHAARQSSWFTFTSTGDVLALHWPSLHSRSLTCPSQSYCQRTALLNQAVLCRLLPRLHVVSWAVTCCRTVAFALP